MINRVTRFLLLTCTVAVSAEPYAPFNMQYDSDNMLSMRSCFTA